MISAARRLPSSVVRSVGAAVVLTIGSYATLSAYAVAVKSSRPEMAYKLMSRDADVKAAMAERLLTTAPGPAARSQADLLARQALLRDPLNVSAVATLGLLAQVRGDVSDARRFFAYAQHLSRRDYRTQIWAIEDSVGRNDVDDALRHYDIALRTHKTAPALLFPILAQALTDVPIRTGAEALLLRGPPWGGSFLSFISEDRDPLVATDLVYRLTRRGYPVPITAKHNLIGSLVKAGELDQAWRLYSVNQPNIVRYRSRYPDFAQPAYAASAFDWNPANDGPISATIDRTDTGSVLNFSVSSGSGGMIVQQLQYLPPGRYALTGKIAGARQPTELSPYWTLTCLDGRELGRQSMGGGNDTMDFVANFTVPVGCSGQWLRLIARPSDAIEGVTGTIAYAQLRPVG